MANKVFVVSGATSGIGKALALALANTGETVVVVARDSSQANQDLHEITMSIPEPRIDVQLCDLSILSSVRNLAEILKSRYDKIDVLINNAGVYRKKRVVTVDGFEEMFAANHLGPFLLTNLLLERLQAAVTVNGSARILNITAPSKVPVDFDNLQGEREFNAHKAFDATKTASLLFTQELARRLENTGITVHAIDPGLTPLRLFARLTSNPPEKAIDYIVQVATNPEFAKTGGKFLHAGKELETPVSAMDLDAQQRLWQISEDLSALTLTKGVMPINDPKL